MFNLIGAISLLSLSFAAGAEIQPWRNYKNLPDLKVVYTVSKDGIYHIYAELFVADARTAQLLTLLYNTQQASQWLHAVQEVRLLHSQGNRNRVYTVINSPWPVADRELYTQSCYQRVNDYTTELRVHAYNPNIARKSDRIRITTLTANWRMTQQDDGLLIRYQVFADPGGKLPRWLSNKVSLKSVSKTMMSLKSQLAAVHALQVVPISAGDCGED
ncbi:hypothetical protein W04_0634 [Pseudoalteromonas sp. SW0106-04]|uniref:START domain-containing protein n=1 Tax=Pseudoalteromonas sp. SW0106-04 TaxID=1702169 RepID=UPI0006B46C36|nr:START domain-containing protein [Pseudoalteromonas sp. SW0106-04]GAP74122.1 hypothetical protein W04_0634 [Pseudoalteromonas sp. SW0106-04]